MITQTFQRSDLLPLKHSEYNAQLLRTSMFSDCTVHSAHRVWYLHRCILSPRCEFFWTCFQGDFDEASTASVEMHDDDPDTLERLIRWIYLLEYPECSNKQRSWSEDLMLYMMADKYGLTELMSSTKQALLSQASRCANSPEVFLQSSEDFVDAMQMLYEDFPERDDLAALREELLSLVAPMFAKYLRDTPVLLELMTAIPGFGVALVESLAKYQPDRRQSSSSIASHVIDSGICSSRASSNSPQYTKPYIPLNEDSDDELI